jgi:hypothetical protein
MKQITLNIGGQDRIFCFGLGFLGNLLEVENIAFHEIDEKIKENPFKWIPLIMFHSCSFGYIKNNETIPFNKYVFSDWIDELGVDNEVVTNFFNAFTQSLTKDVPKQLEDKKKVAKK